ncbi:MAG TPA: DUF6400 family protein [Mycobacterium sp.]|jgi:hypothetical protein|nr:DUF6400 family protein [Mycobacterium sp.]
MADAARHRDVHFAYDMTLDEIRRRRAVLEAIGEDWDPVQAMTEEDMASRMLYSDLDDEQQRIFDGLVRAGVLPDRA